MWGVSRIRARSFEERFGHRGCLLAEGGNLSGWDIEIGRLRFDSVGEGSVGFGGIDEVQAEDAMRAVGEDVKAVAIVPRVVDKLRISDGLPRTILLGASSLGGVCFAFGSAAVGVGSGRVFGWQQRCQQGNHGCEEKLPKHATWQSGRHADGLV